MFEGRIGKILHEVVTAGAGVHQTLQLSQPQHPSSNVDAPQDDSNVNARVSVKTLT